MGKYANMCRCKTPHTRSRARFINNVTKMDEFVETQRMEVAKPVRGTWETKIKKEKA